jgi:hypothetical protein
MSKPNMSYEERLLFLKIISLEKRRKIQILKIVFKMRFNLNEYRHKWLNEISFHETSRNGIFCNVSLHKTICDKSFFIYASNLFNSLPKNIRCINNYNSFVKEFNSFLYNTYVFI